MKIVWKLLGTKRQTITSPVLHLAIHNDAQGRLPEIITKKYIEGLVGLPLGRIQMRGRGMTQSVCVFHHPVHNNVRGRLPDKISYKTIKPNIMRQWLTTQYTTNMCTGRKRQTAWAEKDSSPVLHRILGLGSRWRQNNPIHNETVFGQNKIGYTQPTQCKNDAMGD